MILLSQDLWTQLQNVLQRAFDVKDLLQLATVRLQFKDQRLADVVNFRESKKDVAFQLIKVAEECGQIEQLIRAIQAERSSRSDVADLVKAYELENANWPKKPDTTAVTPIPDVASTALKPAHPLHAYPRGPIVPAEKVTFAILDAFTQCVSAPLAIQVVNSANTFRRDADSDALVVEPHWVGAADADPFLFWTKVFNRARGQGPRMVAALLTLPTRSLIDYDQFPAQAKADRQALLDYLRRLPPVS